ncbi:unnamed protein product [Phytomonas sp. EM1]|nr:unnamed protein product [Phytomonas sp. EM1]|eukprot:CCW61508.1 unnamed protein product [Phytomonas sp. isolate EM1]
MHQGTLTSFFMRKRGREGVDVEAFSEKFKQANNDLASKASCSDTGSVPQEPLDVDVGRFYNDFEKHREDFQRFLDSAEKSSAPNMAKLFQGDPFNPLDGMLELWPRLPEKNDFSRPSIQPAAVSSVPYSVVVDTLVDISSTSSRLECVKLLTRLFQTVIARSPDDLVAVIYLVINKQAPQHQGVELGIGDAVLVKVVADCCGMTEARVREEYRRTGDLAEIAQDNKQKQATLMTPTPLSARDVFNAFFEIAIMSGKDTMRRRADIIKRLLRNAQGPEINLIVRSLQQKMRIGLAELSALTAVGYAFALNFLGPQAEIMRPEELQTALNASSGSFCRFFFEVPSLDIVVATVLHHGFMLLLPGTSVAVAHAKELSIRPGLPVKPQLAHPTAGISVILDRLQGKSFTTEYKYDGERAQIHYQREKGYQIFSRNSENHTGKYPDVISMLPSAFDAARVESFIIDSEVVAVSPETGALQAFQVLQHRGRKNILEKDVKIPVCVFVFDILYFNGESQLHKSLQERRALLWQNFIPIERRMSFATYLDSDNVEDMQKFLEKSIADGCEGLMIKTLLDDATYIPAKRSHSWLKLKKDYMDGVTDTLDLVPIAAYYGKGKRTGVYGGFLLACYDSESDEYQSICKIGTGFQESELEGLTQSLQSSVVMEKPGYYRANGADVDVWLRELQVWEVKAADLSISPAHFAAIGLIDPDRGVALRFPRFLRVREDKKPTDCTSAQQVADMYRSQSLAIQKEKKYDPDEY